MLLTDLSWPMVPAGNRIRYIWQEWLQNHLQDYQGGVLLTLDSLTQCLNMPDNVFDYHLKIGPSLSHGVNAEPESLPLMADSIHSSIISLGFDYTDTASVLLGEIHRALEPQGYIYAVMYAPANPWYLKAKAGLSHSDKQLPTNQISQHRFNDWLGLLGFEVISAEVIGCPWWKGFSHFQYKSDMPLAWLSAPIAYMVKAQKKVSTLTPIKALKKDAALRVAPGLANVATKEGL